MLFVKRRAFVVALLLAGMTCGVFASTSLDTAVRGVPRATPDAGLAQISPMQRVMVAKAADTASSGGSVEKSIFIKATPEECFRVATAYEDYPIWAKATAGVSVLNRQGDLGKQVEMRMGMFGIEVKSTFEYKYSRPQKMEWKSVAGNIKELYGCYTFTPKGEGTLVTYRLKVEPGFPLPQMIKMQTNKVICSTALGELKSYTENPKTLARLRGSSGMRKGAAELWAGSLEAALLCKHIM